MLMGIATFLVSLVPTYESVGLWGAVILTFLRFVQIGVGGEWGGSVLMSMEWARGDKHRGFIASWPQFGVPCGLFLANLAVLAFSQMSGEQFLTWGWRVPFFLSLILVAVGLYIRLGILETPIFRKLVAEQKIERTPMLAVIKQQPKEILLSALVRMAEQAPFYIFTAFVFSYETSASGRRANETKKISACATVQRHVDSIPLCEALDYVGLIFLFRIDTASVTALTQISASMVDYPLLRLYMPDARIFDGEILSWPLSLLQGSSPSALPMAKRSRRSVSAPRSLSHSSVGTIELPN